MGWVFKMNFHYQENSPLLCFRLIYPVDFILIKAFILINYCHRFLISFPNSQLHLPSIKLENHSKINFLKLSKLSPLIQKPQVEP